MAPTLSSALVAPRHMPQLPNECLLIIAQYATGETLQHLRLSSKTFQRIADPVLFRETRLVPNIDCLQSFCNIIDGRSIAHHIQTLIYDTSWQSLADELKSKSMRGDLLGASAGHLSDATVLTKCVEAQVRSSEGSGVETALLTRILCLLPNINTLRCIERLEARVGKDDAPPYFRSICRRAGISVTSLKMCNSYGAVRYVSHVRSLLLATYSSGTQVEYLDLVKIPWITFFQDTTSLTDPTHARLSDFHYRKQVFKNLKYLDIDFHNTPSRDPDTHLRGLREILIACLKLERLRLRMADYVQKRYSTDYRMFSFLGPLVEGRSMKPLMPRLRELHLDSCICTQNDLINLLMMHSATLRVLTLSDISLLRQEDNDTRGCWVQVIQSLKHVLRLDVITFRKWLCNGGRQRWHVSADAIVDPSRLRPQIERYIIKGSSSPLPTLMDAVAVRSGSGDVPKSRTGAEEEGDWTWAMTYGQNKSTRDIRPDTFSGNDFFSKDVPLDTSSPEFTLYWDDWDFVAPEQPYPNPKYSYPPAMPPKTKIALKPSPYPPYPPSPYSISKTATSNLPTWYYSKAPPPPPKNVSTTQQPYVPLSNWGTSGSSSSISQDTWLNPISPVPASIHSASSSNVSEIAPSNVSDPSYIEDDIIFAEASYHSPSQHSQSLYNPPYTPSHSSHVSTGSIDPYASWNHPPAYAEASTATNGSNHSLASNSSSSQTTFDSIPSPWGTIWADTYDYAAAAPDIALKLDPAVSSTMHYPSTASNPTFSVSPIQSSTKASHAPLSQSYAHPVSTNEAFAILNQAQSSIPPYGGHSYSSLPTYSEHKKVYSHNPQSTPLSASHALPFGLTLVQDTLATKKEMLSKLKNQEKHQINDGKLKKIVPGVKASETNGGDGDVGAYETFGGKVVLKW